jgi:hypothetical protein
VSLASLGGEFFPLPSRLRLEEVLTIRLAVISWRLSRVVRYEEEVAAASVAAAEAELDDRAEDDSGKLADPEEARATAAIASRIVEILKKLLKMADGENLDAKVAAHVLCAL